MLRALDYDTELYRLWKLTISRTCELLDGHITVGAEEFHCTEVYFQLKLLGKGASGDEVRH